jgi:transcription initiation factor IIE alpha subunit
MEEIPHLSAALGRLRAVFRELVGTELTDTDIAELARLEGEECRILLRVLEDTGAIEQRRGRVFVFRQSSWWASTTVRDQQASP